MRRHRPVVFPALLGAVILAGWVLGWNVHPSAGGPATPPPDAKTTPTLSLSDQKVTAEIRLAQAQRSQLIQQAASARAGDALWRQVLTPLTGFLAATATAVVAFLAIVLPVRRQRELDRLQREDSDQKDREERETAAAHDVAQRQKDLVARFDAGFAAAVRSLGDDSEVVQAGGAAALQSYLRDDLIVFAEQVFLVVRANLDSGLYHGNPVRRLLVSALCRALQQTRHVSELKPPHRKRSFGRGDGLDLARTWLRGADLRHVDLASADLAYSDLAGARLDGARLRRSWGWKTVLAGASLRGADLEEARFRGAVGPSAVFDGARLVSARFEEADLTGARFRGALLQAAHFDGARLEGADFRNANVADAYFFGATFDLGARESLLLSSTWRSLGSPQTSEQELGRVEQLIRQHVDGVEADRLVAIARRKRAGAGGSAP